ncbi:MAG: hypothetical protein KDD99_05805 [Bacteroidetes bacterium]|nr:hypothetical protein [Bacteroidota bacterium]
MIQTILVFILFGAACFYLGRMAYLTFFSKDHKCEGCALKKMYQSKT